MSNFNMKKCSKSKIFDQDDLKNDENFNKDEPDVKSEVVTDSDESLSIKKSKRKKSKIKKVKKVSSKENKNFEKQFLLDNSTVKLENESEDPDASVLMLKSLVDGIADVSSIWDVVREKIIPNFQIWNILLDKASFDFDLEFPPDDCDLRCWQNERNRRKFVKVLNEIEMILAEFKCMMDTCLTLAETQGDPLDVRLSPELCRAFDVPITTSFKMSEKSESESLYRYFFFDHDFEESELDKPEKPSRKVRNGEKSNKRDDEADVATDVNDSIGDDNDDLSNSSNHDAEEYPEMEDDHLDVEDDLKNLVEDQGEEDDLQKSKPKKSRPKKIRRKRIENTLNLERPKQRPFRKNPEDKRYYCTFPGCTAGEKKNWTCSSGVWKHFLSEHSDVAGNTFCVFPCDSCDRRFPTKALLNQHQKEKHITHFEFVCSVCPKRLPTNVALLVHMRMHTGEKPFSCDLCSYKSIRQSAVNQHKVRMHENEQEPRLRKHVCDKCGKTFKERCKLKEHIKTHSDIRTFLCGFCGKGLKNRQSLNRHMFTHGLKYECTDCGKYFSTPNTLGIHQRDKHGMTI